MSDSENTQEIESEMEPDFLTSTGIDKLIENVTEYATKHNLTNRCNIITILDTYVDEFKKRLKKVEFTH